MIVDEYVYDYVLHRYLIDLHVSTLPAEYKNQLIVRPTLLVTLASDQPSTRMNHPTLPGADTLVNPPSALTDSDLLGPRSTDAEDSSSDVWVCSSAHLENSFK